MAVAVTNIVPQTAVSGVDTDLARLGDLEAFRRELYGCLTARADALFELTDAVLCTDGPVTTLVGLSLAPEHRRGHGSLYDCLNEGGIDFDRFRKVIVGQPVPRCAGGRVVLGIDVSNWLRPDAPTSPDRLFCHTYGRGRNQAQMIPGWPYSFVAALGQGRSSWCAVLDAQPLGPNDDETTVAATQLRAVVERLIAVGHWKPGDPQIWIVGDSGYDGPRLAHLLADLPVQLLVRLRSDRVLCTPVPPREHTGAGRPARHTPRGPPRRPPDLARAHPHHHHPDHPVRHRGHPRVRPAAPTADPPRRLGRPRRGPAHHRGHPSPAPGRPPPRRRPAETAVAVVVGDRGHPRGGGPPVADLSAPFRPGAHLPVPQADPGLDPAQGPVPRGR